jgi:hypothetical protein
MTIVVAGGLFVFMDTLLPGKISNFCDVMLNLFQQLFFCMHQKIVS